MRHKFDRSHHYRSYIFMFTHSAKLMSGHRSASGSVVGRSPLDRKSSVNSSASASGLGRQPSYNAGTAAKYGLPPPVHAASPAVAAPPPYTAGGTGLASTAGSIKKAPPPPPPMKRAASAAPQPEICVALYDFAPQVCCSCRGLAVASTVLD